MKHVFNTRHGDYVLASRIAMGGMGEVFLALDAENPDRFVALKVLHAHLHDEPKVVEMFYREARLGALFRHRNLVRVYRAGVIRARHSMVMEFAPGVTLRQLLDRLEERGETFPTFFVLDTMRQLAEALGYAHRLTGADGEPLGVVHRDLSPDNVLIGFDGVVRLLDFGVAAAATSANELGLAGKIAYMSPEQCRGEPLDARADLYALGTLYWEMLQGRAAYPRTDRILALRAITEEGLPPPAASSGRELATDLDGLWERLHTKYPRDRVGDASRLVLALDALIQKLDAPPHEPMGGWVQRLFPHESAELRTVCEKILRAPAPTENTVDLDYDSFSLSSDLPSKREVKPPPAPVSIGADTAEVDHIQLSPTEYTSVRQIRRRRIQRNLFLFVAVALLAALILFLVLPKSPPAPLPPAPIHFTLRAVPPDATISANGARASQETPAIIETKVGELLTLDISSPGYLPVTKTFRVEEALAVQGMDVRLEVDRASPVAPIGSIRVNYVPEQAEFSLNGKVLAGHSPALVENIPLNTLHTLRLEHEGYQTVFVDLRLPSDALLEFDLQMVEGVPLARLSVDSTPEGATVFIDEQEVGTTPLKHLELPANTAYDLQVRSSGYRSWRKGVLLQTEDQALTVQLERVAAEDAIDAAPVPVPVPAPAPVPPPKVERTRAADLPYRMLD